MRPDIVAFRELDALVRKLTEQLAGYRRRALSAESRTRELEGELEAMQASLAAAQQDVAQAAEAKDHALAAAREATAAARTAREALAEIEEAAQAHDASGTNGNAPVRASADATGDTDETSVENARLRAKLSEARERTAQLADRVRFLRQQLSHGAER